MPQSLSSIFVHLIFATKNREPFITTEIEPELHAYLAAVCRECDSPALLVGGTANHVHVLCALSRKVAVADLVEEVKKRSSKWIKTKGAGLRQFQWQTGYGAFSIGRSNVDALKSYIAGQKEHHRRRTFEEEYRALLDRYGVEYYEKFVWD
jgi:REP element-mobilizing transposase RayT